MKGKLGLIVPIAMMLFGLYALMTVLGSSGEQVTLWSDHALPRGLAMVIALMGLVGGAVVMFTSLSNRKLTDHP
jgi:hypothetical protein